jgi:hypothetical protein
VIRQASDDKPIREFIKDYQGNKEIEFFGPGGSRKRKTAHMVSAAEQNYKMVASYRTERNRLVGRAVSKFFPAHERNYGGTVRYYHFASDTYTIQYEDKDQEVISYSDLLIILATESPAAARPKGGEERCGAAKEDAADLKAGSRLGLKAAQEAKRDLISCRKRPNSVERDLTSHCFGSSRPELSNGMRREAGDNRGGGQGGKGAKRSRTSERDAAPTREASCVRSARCLDRLTCAAADRQGLEVDDAGHENRKRLKKKLNEKATLNKHQEKQREKEICPKDEEWTQRKMLDRKEQEETAAKQEREAAHQREQQEQALREAREGSNSDMCQCQECLKPGLGREDPDDGLFYCDSCWSSYMEEEDEEEQEDEAAELCEEEKAQAQFALLRGGTETLVLQTRKHADFAQNSCSEPEALVAGAHTRDHSAVICAAGTQELGAWEEAAGPVFGEKFVPLSAVFVQTPVEPEASSSHTPNSGPWPSMSPHAHLQEVDRGTSFSRTSVSIPMERMLSLPMEAPGAGLGDSGENADEAQQHAPVAEALGEDAWCEQEAARLRQLALKLSDKYREETTEAGAGAWARAHGSQEAGSSLLQPPGRKAPATIELKPLVFGYGLKAQQRKLSAVEAR